MAIEGEIPNPPKTEDGKRAVMYYNPISKEFWFQFAGEFMWLRKSEEAHKLEARLDELLRLVLKRKGLIGQDEIQSIKSGKRLTHAGRVFMSRQCRGYRGGAWSNVGTEDVTRLQESK